MYIDIIKNTISIFKYTTMTKLNRIKKIIKLLDSIDIIENDNTVVINIDKHLMLNHSGSIIIHSNDGYLITKHMKTHINPRININGFNPNTIMTKADVKADMLRKQNLFTSLLTHKKIHSL